MIIDTGFNFYSDARGGDPDSTSPTLRKYHKLLWSKPLPDGSMFTLNDDIGKYYLYHESKVGSFYLGSDAITHSYKNQKRKKWLVEEIPNDVKAMFDAGSTIGAYTLFPKNRINGKQTINQARGINRLIDDRFDLTLECIRRFYIGQKSPLYQTLTRYKSFFDLFKNFRGYVDFFLLNDLVDENGNILFYLPFDNFKTRPMISSIEDYLVYKQGVIRFIELRNKRVQKWQSSL